MLTCAGVFQSTSDLSLQQSVLRLLLAAISISDNEVRGCGQEFETPPTNTISLNSVLRDSSSKTKSTGD